MQKLPILLGFSGFLAGLTSVCLLPSARAAFDTLAGITCQPQDGAMAHAYATASTGSSAQNTSTSAKGFLCAIPEETARPLTAITSIRIDVVDSHAADYIWVRTCSWATTGAGCDNDGPNARTGVSSVGPKTLIAELDDENHLPLFQAGESAYLYVVVPKGDVAPSKINAIHVIR